MKKTKKATPPAGDSYFSLKEPLRYEGTRYKPSAKRPMGYRWYDPERKVLGKRMEDQLRFAVCYWHSFVWEGTDAFGGETFNRPWHAAGGDPMAQAHLKADTAFELFRLLRAPYFTFHDRDIAPEGATLRESNLNVRRIGEVFEKKMAATGVKLLWGGREGYETLLNTDLKRELAQLGRFLNLVVEHKHKIGFKGTILIEPKPAEPTKHQYDFDVATVYGFLKAHGLEKEIKVNIEQNHALLAGHTFEHEIALAQALGIFGSIDMNRGDEMLGWDTDQFPNNLPQVALALYQILQGGGFGTGGLNFDAKLRRQSIDPDDLIAAHAGAMDLTARALLVAEKMIEDGALASHVAQRYAGWDGKLGKSILAGKQSLDDLARLVAAADLEPQPRSGRQEQLEALVNTYL